MWAAAIINAVFKDYDKSNNGERLFAIHLFPAPTPGLSSLYCFYFYWFMSFCSFILLLLFIPLLLSSTQTLLLTYNGFLSYFFLLLFQFLTTIAVIFRKTLLKITFGVFLRGTLTFLTFNIMFVIISIFKFRLSFEGHEIKFF